MWLNPQSADFLKELLDPPSQFKGNEDAALSILTQVINYMESESYKKKKNNFNNKGEIK